MPHNKSSSMLLVIRTIETAKAVPLEVPFDVELLLLPPELGMDIRVSMVGVPIAFG
ncbi:MAG: hypothetical protein JSS82_07850 [Bacteroidetes bacterium]|nr:hypothetical protein [Bacteroidota bacterium]